MNTPLPTNDRQKMVDILKALQLESMAVDTDLHPEDNVEYLTGRLSWAELRILRIISAAQTQLLERLLEQKEEFSVDVKDDYWVTAVPVAAIQAKLKEVRGE